MDCSTQNKPNGTRYRGGTHARLRAARLVSHHRPDRFARRRDLRRMESDKRVGTKGAGWLHRLRDDEDWRDGPVNGE